VSTSPFVHLFGEEIYNIPQAVVIVVARSWESYSVEEKTLLAKILGSVKLDVASVRIVNREKITHPEMAQLASQKVLIFGAETPDIKPYENQQAQGFTVIKADDLSGLDDTKKKSLWLALRNMFGI
jgi:DNA polymerase III psi subunit